MECLSEINSELCSPETGVACEYYYLADADPCGETTQTASVRLVITGLTIGMTYQATVHVDCSSCGLLDPGYDITWCFTATATTETTGYESIVGAAIDGCVCDAVTCEVVSVASC